MNKQSRKKRFLLNGLALLVIVAVALVALTSYQSDDSAASFRGLPPLKVLKPVRGMLLVNEKYKEVGIALEVSKTLTNYEDIATDVVTVYDWSRQDFDPILCGPLAPPNMCVDSRVLIYLVVKREVPSDAGSANTYVKVLGMWLDQIYIDVLVHNPPRTLDDLGTFHADAYEASLGTQALINDKFADPTLLYRDLSDFYLGMQ